jgi:hypothetical protein
VSTAAEMEKIIHLSMAVEHSEHAAWQPQQLQPAGNTPISGHSSVGDRLKPSPARGCGAARPKTGCVIVYCETNREAQGLTSMHCKDVKRAAPGVLAINKRSSAQKHSGIRYDLDNVPEEC